MRKEKPWAIFCPCCGQSLTNVEEIITMVATIYRRLTKKGTYEHIRAARVCMGCKVKIVIHPMPRRWRPAS